MELIIVAPWSNKMLADGSTQRFIWVDSNIFNGISRCYLEISFKKNWRKIKIKDSNIQILRLNFFLHFFLINYICIKSKYIYVHSLYNAIKVLPIYFIKEIVTDLHGVVPEELNSLGNFTLSKIFTLVEYIVIIKSKYIIYVTKRMRNHIEKKYKKNLRNDLIIPIYPDVDFESIEAYKVNYKDQAVVYSGGIQAWQNIDLMIDAASKNRNYEYIFLSSSFEYLKKICENRGVIRYICKQVTQSEVMEMLKYIKFGFILRDDNIINNVACPTKIVEYISSGVIPIVLSANIGDFDVDGYEFLDLYSFSNNDIPDEDYLNKIKFNNFNLLKLQYSRSMEDVNKIRKYLIE